MKKEKVEKALECYPKTLMLRPWGQAKQA